MSTSIEISLYLTDFKKKNKKELLEKVHEIHSDLYPEDWEAGDPTYENDDMDTEKPVLCLEEKTVDYSVEENLPEIYKQLKEIEPKIKLFAHVRYIEQVPHDTFSFGVDD